MSGTAWLRWLARSALAPLALLQLLAPTSAQDSNRPAVVVVLDVSNSMWGQVNGKPKIDIAREALNGLIADWKPDVDLGLIAFGHRREGDCSDIEMVQPVGPVDAPRFSQTVAGLTPTGKTPMTEAVRRAADALRYQDRPATVILFSDGIETCNADPCALASELEQGGVRFTAHVVGLDVAEGEKQLACLAETTGGLFLTADSAPELNQAIDTVVEAATEPEKTDRITLEAVLQGSDAPILEGVVWRVVSLGSETSVPITAGTARPVLPLEPGKYMVEASLGTAVARKEITVVADTAATHRLVLDAALAAAAATTPPRLEESTGAGLILEREPNGSFGQPTSPPVRPEAEAAMPGGGVSFGQAHRVELPATATVQLQPNQSAWLRFTAISQGELGVSLQDAPAGVEFSVRLWNREQSALTNWQLLSGQPTTFDLATPAEYILEVYGKNTTPTPATLKVGLVPTKDVSEPNDSFARATPLTLGQDIFGSILPVGEADWFFADIAGQGQIRFELTEAAQDIELVVRLWDREQRAQNWLPLNLAQPVLFDITAPGAYRFELRDSGDDERALVPYRVKTAFQPTGDKREPNDTFGMATIIASGEELVGTLFPAPDADWFLLDLAEQGRLSALLTAEPTGVQPLIRLWNSEQQVMVDWQQLRRDQPVDFDLMRRGRYLLELRDNNNDERSLEPYRLTATLTPTQDTHEPNDSFGEPTLVEPTGEYEGAILPRGDAEWLAFDVPALGALDLTLTQPVNELQTVVRLWNSEQSVLVDWGNLQAGKVTYDLAAAGRYFLELRDSADDGSSPQRYRVDMKFQRADVAALNPAPGDGIFTGTMFPKGDGDYLQIAATAAGALTLTAETVPPEIQLVAQVWDADQRVVAGWTNMLPGAAQTVSLSGPGRYTFEFRDSNGDERSLTPYRVAVNWPGRDLVVRQEQSGQQPPGDTITEPAVTDGGATTGGGTGTATGSGGSAGGTSGADTTTTDTSGETTGGGTAQPGTGTESTGGGAETAGGGAAGGGAAGGGKWTEWFDIDDPGASGDWEPLQALIDAHGVCAAPTAIECETVDGKDWKTAGQAYRCEPGIGGICRTKEQADGQECLDYRVRFTCP